MAAHPGHSEVPSFEKIFVNMELVFKDCLSNIEHVLKNEDRLSWVIFKHEETKSKTLHLIILSHRSSPSSIPFTPLSPDHKPDSEFCLSIDSDHPCHLISLINFFAFCSYFLPGFFPLNIYTHLLLPASAIVKSVPLVAFLLNFSNPQQNRLGNSYIRFEENRSQCFTKPRKLVRVQVQNLIFLGL